MERLVGYLTRFFEMFKYASSIPSLRTFQFFTTTTSSSVYVDLAYPLAGTNQFRVLPSGVGENDHKGISIAKNVLAFFTHLSQQLVLFEPITCGNLK